MTYNKVKKDQQKSIPHLASLARSAYLIATLEIQSINLLSETRRSLLHPDCPVRHVLKVILLTGVCGGILKKQKSSYISLLEEYFLISNIYVCTGVYTVNI